jgi:nucleotide-binding universal stress UspA family protein
MTMKSALTSQQLVQETAEEADRPMTILLVAVGSSADESPAVKLGTALAREHGARVHVVHVREHQVYGCAVVGFESSDDAHRVVEKAVSEIRGEGVGATGRVVRTIIGHVPAAILSEADDVDADEIIIDSQRAGALLRRRTTQRLLRRSWLPVVVAPYPGAGRDHAALTRQQSVRRAG